MALREFWISVRTAARQIVPKSAVDSPRIDPEHMMRSLRGSTIWLTPGAVEGFDPADFDFLPEDERARMTGFVSDFLAVASTVNPKAPAPPEAVTKALPHFMGIVQALGFDRYGDPEAYRLGKQIERALKSDWPPELAELRVVTGLDHSGEPALRIWAIVSREASQNDEQFLEAVPPLRERLEPIARKVAPDRWPYLSFRSLEEQDELVEAS